MPKSKKRKNHTDTSVQCLHCKKIFENASLWKDGRVHSQGLACHLNHESKFSCHQFYVRNGLFPIVNKKYDFRSSLVCETVRNDEFRQSHPCLPSHTPQDFGLTGAANGPHDSNTFQRTKMLSGSNKICHRLLNQQTMFIGTIPSVCRENIEALLSTDNNTDDKVSSDSIVDQAAIDDDDETTHFQNHEMSDANEDDNEADENNDGDIDDDDDDDVNATREDDNAAVIGSCSVVGDVPLSFA